jgi:hypothetical protein
MSNSAVDDLVGDADPEPPGVVDGLSYEEREDEFLRLLGMGCTVRESARAVAVELLDDVPQAQRRCRVSQSAGMTRSA